jgi:hypothetical protein
MIMSQSDYLSARTDFLIEGIRERLGYEFESFEPVPPGWINAAFLFRMKSALTIIIGSRDVAEDGRAPHVLLDEFFVRVMEPEPALPVVDAAAFESAAREADSEFVSRFPKTDNWTPMFARLFVKVHYRFALENQEVPRTLQKTLAPLVAALRAHSVVVPWSVAMYESDVISVGTAQQMPSKYEVEILLGRRIPEQELIATAQAELAGIPYDLLGVNREFPQEEGVVARLSIAGRQF